MPESAEILARFEADGLLRREAEEYRTTRRWQAAMARAAFNLFGAGDPGDDLRTPIALAMVEFYGSKLSDEEIAKFVLAMAPIEARELDPTSQLRRAQAATNSAAQG